MRESFLDAGFGKREGGVPGLGAGTHDELAADDEEVTAEGDGQRAADENGSDENAAGFPSMGD